MDRKNTQITENPISTSWKVISHSEKGTEAAMSARQ